MGHVTVSDDAGRVRPGEDAMRSLMLRVFTWRQMGDCLRLGIGRSPVMRLLLPALFALTVVKEILAYFVGILSSQFYPILASQDQDAFFKQVLKASAIVFAMAFTITLQNYAVRLTQINWRKALTEELQRRYFASDNFYKVNCIDSSPNVANPDQRITQDVNELCESFCSTMPVLFISPITIGYYIFQSVMITGSFVSPLIVLTFALLCSIMSKVFMTPISREMVEQQRREAALRKQHLDIVSNAESVAFINGAACAERDQSDLLLDQLLQTKRSVACRYIPLDLTLTSTDYFYGVLSMIITAIPVFAGNYAHVPPSELSGIISKNAFVTIYLASCFSNLLRLAKNLVTVQAMAFRITNLMDSFDEYDSNNNISSIAALASLDDGDPLLQLTHVSYDAPLGGNCGRLVSNLTVEFRCGHNILITGPSNAGKTSLFRILRGLWAPSEGSVKISGDVDSMMFVPSRTFLGKSCTTLQKTVTYPNGQLGRDTTVDKVMRYLQLLRLDHLVARRSSRSSSTETGDSERLDNADACANAGWSAEAVDAPLSEGFLENLSPGERQRLALCRVLLEKPRIVLLDEAFNSLDHAMIETFFNECQRQRITVITISHQVDVLSRYHDYLLEICSNGLWFYKPIEHNANLESSQNLISQSGSSMI